MNTCMVFEQNTRFHASELDLGENVKASKEFYIDVISENMEETSDSYELIEKIRASKKYLKAEDQGKLDLGIKGEGESSFDDEDFVINDSPLPNEGGNKMDFVAEKEENVKKPLKLNIDNTKNSSNDKNKQTKKAEEPVLDLISPNKVDESPKFNEEEQKALDNIIASSSDEDSGDDEEDSNEEEDEDMDAYMKKLES